MNDINKKLAAIGKAISTIKENMATKDDLKKLETRLDGKMENLEKRLIGRIDDAQMEIIEVVEKHKADKIKVNNLEQRVDRLEDNAVLPPLPTQ